ncbi:MAG: diacylglycerol kinase family lipid kinase [Anaerolineales bacterium]|nr:diacylglycerol kinase family lipid kinase [Anaerolineales bacterium]
MQGQLIYNPMAGRFPSLPLVERAAKTLESNGWKIEIKQTEGGDQITKLAKKAASSGLDAIFVAGGDGSIHSAAAGLLGSETALAVLPAGTANVWAQELGLPTLSWTNWGALETSVQKILTGSVRTMDVGVCQGIPFLLWAGIGFDAFIVHHLEPRSRWQKQLATPHYAANVAWYARNWSGMDLNIWADGTKVSGIYVLALVTNIHLYAGGLAEISPKARIDDGCMDLWLFAGDTLLETLQHLFDLASGKHFSSEKTNFIPCKEVIIKSKTDLYLQLDGEPIPPSKKISIDIRPRSLRVLVPQDVPRPLFSQSQE